jgi:hypothetical protein
MQFPILIERAPICSTPNLAIYLQDRYLSCLAGGMNAPAVHTGKTAWCLFFPTIAKLRQSPGTGVRKRTGIDTRGNPGLHTLSRACLDARLFNLVRDLYEPDFSATASSLLILMERR